MLYDCDTNLSHCLGICRVVACTCPTITEWSALDSSSRGQGFGAIICVAEHKSQEV